MVPAIKRSLFKTKQQQKMLIHSKILHVKRGQTTWENICMIFGWVRPFRSTKEKADASDHITF